MKISNYYLDLDKVLKLNEEDKRMINHMYTDMISFSSNGLNNDAALSVMYTLLNGGFLKEVRDEKIEQIHS